MANGTSAARAHRCVPTRSACWPPKPKQLHDPDIAPVTYSVTCPNRKLTTVGVALRIGPPMSSHDPTAIRLNSPRDAEGIGRNVDHARLPFGARNRQIGQRK